MSRDIIGAANLIGFTMLKAIEQRLSALVIGGIIAAVAFLGIVYVSGQLGGSDITGPAQRDQFTTDNR